MSDAPAVMPLPLFHGTSSWFLPGILEHGLGAIDVHARLCSRAFYRDVWSLRLRLADPGEREKLEQSYGARSDAIIANAVTRGGQNFRYDTIYVTGSERKAVTYAARGYGSELIRVGMGWFEEIQSIDPDLAAATLSGYPELAECVAHEHQPFVVRLDNVDRRYVTLENGKPFPPELDDIAEPLSFELASGANLSAMSIFRVENVAMGFMGAESYDLVPFEARQA